MKNRFLLLLFVSIFLLPFSVYGLEVSCGKNSIEVDGSTTCTITENIEEEGVSLLEVSISSNDVVSLSKSSLSKENPEVGSNSLGTITVTGLKKGTATITFSSTKDGDSIDTKPVTIEVTEVEEEVKLDTLSINGNSVNLREGVYEYSFETDKDKVSISATSKTGTVAGDGEKTLKDGKNTFELVVTKGDDSKKYTIVVTKKSAPEETKCVLKSLSISSGSIDFDSDTFDYNITLDSNITSFSVTVPSEANVNFSPSDSINLKYGETKTISVVVLCANNVSTKYKLNVTRKDVNDNDEVKTSDVNLKKLIIEGVPFDFTPNKISYSITVPSNMEEIKLEYELEDNTSSVEIIGDTKLKQGKNQIKVVVTSQSGKSNTYTLNITRSKSQVIVKNDEEEILKYINDEENSSDIYVNVERTSDKIVSKDILEALLKSKKVITYAVLDDESNIIYTVTIDGEKIKNTDEFDYQLTFISNNDDKLLKLINSSKYLSFKFKNSSKLPCNIDLKIYVGNRSISDKKSVNLYKYNSNKLKTNSKNLKIEDDYISLTVDSSDEYVLTNLAKEKNVKTSYVIPIIVIGVVSLIVVICLIGRKTKSNKRIKKLNTIQNE